MDANELQNDRVAEMMKRSVSSTNPTSLYATHGKAEIVGPAERQKQRRAERREKKSSLSEWYGMKRAASTPEAREELELLKYRNFLNKDTAHLAPKNVNDRLPQFYETGYVVGTGKKKKKQAKSFADDWFRDDAELSSRVEKVMKRDLRKARRETQKKDNRNKAKMDRKKNRDAKKKR